MRKRILSMALALAMMVSALLFSAHAAAVVFLMSLITFGTRTLWIM